MSDPVPQGEEGAAPSPTPPPEQPAAAAAPAPDPQAAAPAPDAAPAADPGAAPAAGGDPFADIINAAGDDPFGGMDQASIDELLKQASFDDPVVAASAPAGGGATSPLHADSATAVAEMPGTTQMKLPDFQQVMADAQVSSIDLLRDVDLNVKIELGRSRMLVEDVLKLSEGAVVELDKLAGDPVDVFVNDRLVARGEVLVLNDNFCVRINEIVAAVKEEGL
jgi:flagellar motor switch protein FliN/FliY